MAGVVETIRQSVTIPAPPLEVYRALVDSTTHADFTGAEATGETRVGATFTAWDGYITGRHLALEEGRRIAQEWSTTEWPEGHPPSTVEFTLAAVEDGTELTLLHTGVPAEQADSYRQG